jgi:iron complex transport system substrate-binding protein
MPSTLRLPLAVTAAAATVLGLAACAPSDNTSAVTPSAPLLASVDTMFGEVEIPEPEGDLRVVALGWSDAEMALALGVEPVAVFDWQGFGAENNGVGPWAADLFNEAPEIIERGEEALNYEQIAVLEPDVILNTRSGNDEAEFQALSEIAPTVYAPEGTAAFATEWDVQMASVSQALGLAAEGEELIADTQADIDAAAEANPEFAGLTATAATKFGDAYGAYLPGDGRFDILADLGFVESESLSSLESAGFFANASAEQVGELEADVVVVYPIGFTLEQAQADPLIQSLPAVQDGRAVFIDPESELAGAYGAASVLSFPVVLEQLVPQLQTAVEAGA